MCLRLQSDIKAFPTLTVVLGSDANAIQLNVTPAAYLTPQACGSGGSGSGSGSSGGGTCYCYGIVSAPVSSGTILGDVFMQSFTVAFDRANSRVGFTAPTC